MKISIIYIFCVITQIKSKYFENYTICIEWLVVLTINQYLKIIILKSQRKKNMFFKS